MLRNSRLGRAWIALREDEVAAVAMGVPAVKTKLLAYGTGAALGGMSGAFLGSFNNTVNADQFQFYFSILILGMVILGGLGSIWGVVLGAIALTTINFYLIPEIFNSLPSKVGLDFDVTQITFAIYGFLLVVMMIMRPGGPAAGTPAKAGAPRGGRRPAGRDRTLMSTAATTKRRRARPTGRPAAGPRRRRASPSSSGA